MCLEWGVLYESTWRMLRVPDRRLGGHSYPWCHGWSYLTPRKISRKFRVHIFIRSVSRIGGPSWGYLTSWMTLVDPKDHILKVSCHYLYFWLRYKGVTKHNKNVTEDKETDKETDRQTDRGTQLNFNIDRKTQSHNQLSYHDPTTNSDRKFCSNLCNNSNIPM